MIALNAAAIESRPSFVVAKASELMAEASLEVSPELTVEVGAAVVAFAAFVAFAACATDAAVWSYF